jgi:hypothetical protein
VSINSDVSVFDGCSHSTKSAKNRKTIHGGKALFVSGLEFSFCGRALRNIYDCILLNWFQVKMTFWNPICHYLQLVCNFILPGCAETSISDIVDQSAAPRMLFTSLL